MYDADEVAMLVHALAPSRAASYRTWMQVGWCPHNVERCAATFGLWDEFHRRCPEKYSADECAAAWSGMEVRPRGLHLRSLHMWARHDAPLRVPRHRTGVCSCPPWVTPR